MAAFIAGLVGSNTASVSWAHDSSPFEAYKRSGWSEIHTEATGLADTPYSDNHLGLSLTTAGFWNKDWLSNPYGWERKNGAEQAADEGTSQEIGPPTDPATWPEPCLITRLNDDLLRCVFEWLVPDEETVPISGFFDHDGYGRKSVLDIVSVVLVGRWWYHIAMNFRALWAVLVPAGKNERLMRLLVERAGKANICLSYEPGIPHDVTDSLLYRASAVYVTDSCGWDMYGRRLGSVTLSNLVVLYLRPSETAIPATSLPSHRGASLNTPRLRILETANPVDVAAPVLAEIGMHYHTTGQMNTTLMTRAIKPQRLVINRPREMGPINWTEFLRPLDSSRLRMLKIRALDGQSARLDAGVKRLSMPCLEILDSTGPISADAMNVVLVKVFNVWLREALEMITRMQSVQELYLRWLGSPSPQKPPSVLLHLSRLRVLRVAGDITADTAHFLESVRAPTLRELYLFCFMKPQPEHEVLQSTRQAIADALANAHGNADVLFTCLQDSQTALARAHHEKLANLLQPVLAVHAGGAQGLAAWNAARAAAESFVERLNRRERRPPAPHGGVLLEGVVHAAMKFAGDEEPLVGLGELKVLDEKRSRGVVHFEAKLRDDSCLMRFTLDGTQTWAYDYDAASSFTLRVSRMLFGLRALRPRVLHIVGGPLDQVPTGFRPAESSFVEGVFAGYAHVEVLRMDYRRAWSADCTFLCRALSNVHSLPALKKVTILGDPEHKNSYGVFDPNMHELTKFVWRPLVAMLKARHELGRPVVTLEVIGDLCVRAERALDVKGLVSTLKLDGAKCQGKKGDGLYCAACLWRADI